VSRAAGIARETQEEEAQKHTRQPELQPQNYREISDQVTEPSRVDASALDVADALLAIGDMHDGSRKVSNPESWDHDPLA
jgi:hypothetical protein